MSRDAQLHREDYFPPAGQSAVLPALDLGIDIQPFSENWRLLKMALGWPALPNHTDPAKKILVDLYDSVDGGATFQRVLTIVEIPGVAINGAPASSGASFGRPWKPVGLPGPVRGPIQLQIIVPAGVGDCTEALFTADWDDEAS